MASPERSPTRDVSRRDVLRLGAGAAIAPLLPAVAGDSATERVVVVAFAGGVRARDVIGTPANAPNLMRIAAAGTTFTKVRCENNGHYGAALSIFTGHSERLGIRDDGRGPNPTLFELLRKDAGLAAQDVWLSTAGGAQGRLFAHSVHPDYGAAYAAQVIDGDGIFNQEFKQLIDSFGRPQQDSAETLALVDRMGRSLDTSASRGNTPDPARVREVQRFILDELSGANSRLTGPGAADAKAIRVGLNLLRAFRPRVLGITLQGHDIAHGSYNGYVEVIRRNDDELGKLWDMIQGDANLRDSTAVLVLPEFGRDQDLNLRMGLDHGDGSSDLHEVFLIGAGPDFRRGRVVRKPIRTIDVCPTVLHLLGHPRTKVGGAKVISDLFA